MNSIPILFMNPAWETLAKLSTNEIVELVMLGVLSRGLITTVGYGVYSALFRLESKD
jgi:hypothetical protein